MELLILLGAALFALGILITMNTSMGGTRSDYNDGSGFISSVGIIFVVIGILGAVITWLF